jgi:hypothetical protein
MGWAVPFSLGEFLVEGPLADWRRIGQHLRSTIETDNIFIMRNNLPKTRQGIANHVSFVLAVPMRKGGVLLSCESPDFGHPSTKPARIVQIGGIADLRFKCVGLCMELRASMRCHTVNATQSSARELCHVDVSSSEFWKCPSWWITYRVTNKLAP